MAFHLGQWDIRMQFRCIDQRDAYYFVTGVEAEATSWDLVDAEGVNVKGIARFKSPFYWLTARLLFKANRRIFRFLKYGCRVLAA